MIDNLMLGRHHLMQHRLRRRARCGGGGPDARRSPTAAGARRSSTCSTSAPYRHQPVGMLPYGIQKRIELGRALAMDPVLLLLDEPVAGMNLEETEDMAAPHPRDPRELDVAMILVEHDMRSRHGPRRPGHWRSPSAGSWRPVAQPRSRATSG